jgi:hypothetical protein
MELAHESQNLARPGRTDTPVPLDLAAGPAGATAALPETNDPGWDPYIGGVT